MATTSRREFYPMFPEFTVEDIWKALVAVLTVVSSGAVAVWRIGRYFKSLENAATRGSDAVTAKLGDLIDRLDRLEDAHRVGQRDVSSKLSEHGERLARLEGRRPTPIAS